MNAFIFHGAYGKPNENWIPYLKEELEKLKIVTCTPTFPTPKNQSLENWRKVIQPYLKDIDENTILIGHSLGPAFILDILESKKALACFFIAPFIRTIGNHNFDTINKTFYKEFDWVKIKENCNKFYIYLGDNDPYVRIELAKEIADKLGTKLNIIKNAGHFNTESGYKKFPLLLNDIKDLV